MFDNIEIEELFLGLLVTKISTQRLDLVSLSAPDVFILRPFFQDPDIRFHFFNDDHPPQKLIDRFLQDNLWSSQSSSCGLWLARNRESQAIIGFGGLVYLPRFPYPELHLAVGREFRRCGYGTEIAMRLIWFALYQKDFKVVLSSVEHTNDPAIRLLLNCRMHLNKIIPWKGRYYHQFAILQSN